MRVPARKYLGLLFKYLKPQWPKALLLCLLMAGGIGFRLYVPQVVRQFIDGAAQGQTLNHLLVLGVVFLSVSLGGELVNAFSRYTSENVGWTATNLMRADLVRHCLSLDMSFHKAHPAGELISRIDGDVNLLSNFFSQFVVGIVSNVILMLGTLVLLFREDWLVGLALTVFTLAALLTVVKTRRLAVPHFTRDRETDAEFYGFLGERLAGTEDIRANGGSGYVLLGMYRYFASWFRIRMRAARASAFARVSAVEVFVIGRGIGLALGVWLWSRGLATVGTVYLLMRYADLLSDPIFEIRNQIQDLQKVDAGIARTTDLLATRSTIESGKRRLPEGPLSVQLDRVCFSYEDGEPVLEDISFSLEPGKVLGLLGRTGSGKTTLGRLLVRFYDPTSGVIRLNGVRSNKADLKALRRAVGVVTQDVQIFHATVRDNLTFFRDGTGDEEIGRLLHDLGLGEWLVSLPQGLDTVLESGGGGLSAGEAQLLALARCFLANPSLIILDEASSRLDPATERLIERALDRLLAGRTAIIIAHRLETIARADEIMILEQGRIVELGDRLVLAADASSRLGQLLEKGAIREALA